MKKLSLCKKKKTKTNILLFWRVEWGERGEKEGRKKKLVKFSEKEKRERERERKRKRKRKRTSSRISTKIPLSKKRAAISRLFVIAA